MQNNKKKKGPIRIEAIAPFLIFCVLVGAYFAFFFDSHLRRAMEWGLTQANGAQVDIDRVKTSFRTLRLDIQRIQATDPARPQFNRLEIGRVEWQMLWDALLRGKIVVETAAIDLIQINTKRTAPGKVLPPDETSDTDWKQVLKDKANELSGGMLAEISDLLDGFDPKEKLKELGDNLKASLKVKEIETRIKEQEQKINATLASIPGDQDLKQIQSKVDSISKGLSKNPIEAKNQIQEMKNLLADAQGRVNKVTEIGGQAIGGAQALTQSVGEIDDAVKQDRQDMMSKLKLPKLDPKALANQLFGNQVLAKATEVRRYTEIAKKYMPPPSKDKAIKTEIKKRRKQGRIYEFGKPNSYPTFWLKRGDISSKGEAVSGGSVDGKILNVSTNQSAVGLPTQIKAKGDFPLQKVMGVNLDFTFDSREHPSTSSIALRVASFPLQPVTLANSDAVKLSILESTGTASLAAKVREKYLELDIDGQFRDLKPQLEAKSLKFADILKTALTQVKVLTLRAKAKGEIPHFDLDIDSNLASALANGLKYALEAKVAEARARVEAMINARIKDERARLESQIKSIQNNALSLVNERKKQAESVQNLVQSRISEAEKQLLPKALPAGVPQDLKKKIFGR